MGNYDELLRFYSFSSLKMQMTASNSQEVIVLQINGSYAGQISNIFLIYCMCISLIALIFMRFRPKNLCTWCMWLCWYVCVSECLIFDVE